MQNLFRGYIKTKNKVPLQKFKNTDKLLTLEQAQELEEYAGVLAEGVVLIDIDDYEQSEILMDIVEDLQLNCRVVATTRGKHFYFNGGTVTKGGTHLKLAVGLESDIKVGNHNSISILKFDGKDRPIIYDIEPDEDYEPAPAFLTPVRGADQELLGLRDGDGRNQTLFNYEWNLSQAGLNEKEIKDTFHLISKYIFQDPLSEKEIESLTRPEAFKKIQEENLMEGKTPNTRAISDLMIRNDHVININGVTHIYNVDFGCYSPDREDLERAMLNYIPTLKINARREVYSYLKLNAPEKNISDKRYILFKNGVYDIEFEEFHELSPAYIIPNQIPFNYNPDAAGQDVDTVLKQWCCEDLQILELLEEMMGYCMLRKNTYRKFFILVGNHRNGKSKYLEMVSNMLGTNNISKVSLEDINSRFKNTGLYEKLANIGDDISGNAITNTATLKKLVSGDPIVVERKGQDPFDMVSYATPIFSANKIPHIQDTTGAVKDRMVIIPFNAHFEEGDINCNPDIMEKLLTDDNMERLIILSLNGLKRLTKNKCFTIPDCVKERLKEYLLESDPVSAFIDEYSGKIIGSSTHNVYCDYMDFCTKNDIRLESKEKLSREINKKLNCKTEPRGRERFYIVRR